MKRRAPEFVVLALDIGSSSVRAALFDEKARPVRGTQTHFPYAIEYSADGAAELSPKILRRAVQTCLRVSLGSRRWKTPIAAIAASTFWHGLLGLDRNG